MTTFIENMKDLKTDVVNSSIYSNAYDAIFNNALGVGNTGVLYQLRDWLVEKKVDVLDNINGSPPTTGPFPSSAPWTFTVVVDGRTIRAKLLDADDIFLPEIINDPNAAMDLLIDSLNDIIDAYVALKTHTDQLTGVTNDPESATPAFSRVAAVTAANSPSKKEHGDGFGSTVCELANSAVKTMTEFDQYKKEWNDILDALENLFAAVVLVVATTNKAVAAPLRDIAAYQANIEKLRRDASAWVLLKLAESACGKVVLHNSINSVMRDKLDGIIAGKEDEFGKAAAAAQKIDNGIAKYESKISISSKAPSL